MKSLPPASSLETVAVRLRGKITGVGYRQAAVREGHLIGVRGWVQALPEGDIVAMVQGTPDQVDKMLEWMRHGPPGARVTDFESEVEYTSRRFDRFEQL
ncbi:acylphosphatase [Pandoraea nosoerga]|uniref:acylphosphatase n=1 Tax=Pandoraea nosoerga TaxID=2508296 RepID=A0A5E4VUR8_9BURK|nr:MULTISPECIES: acylphosphatase [Pandoraea]MBN4667968.1 acylphosphatase [Pandoraea nosoerga]MBN4677886.1 acylphosphatase [Pandoraea nosoerga]MBN4683057.1 acylphosphatase [Pandoraea nosoerga]MBN4747030.1 acylphosphatase [Pandoraea nosoerga]VVE15319.1 acylphosphatase [Pandoraea nosoerga]